MRRHLCILCIAVGGCLFWETVKFVIPFIVFKIREKAKDNHETLICRAHEPCSLGAANFTMTPEELEMNAVFSPDLKAEEVARVHELWEKKFAARRQKGGTPLFIHVGPADLDQEELDMYDRTAPLLQGARIVFLEPHPFQRAKLQQRARLIRNASSMSLSIMAAALCPSESDSVTFYKVSDRFFQDFKETGWLYLVRYWAGLDRRHLVHELQVFCNSTGKPWIFRSLGVFPENFPATVEEWLPYIEELRVRCLTPASLMRELEAGPEAVDVLIMDAEGYDTQLVGMFMELEGFRPATIMFEWHLHGNDPGKLEDLVHLARDLHARGYELHRHNHDVLAVAY